MKTSRGKIKLGLGIYLNLGFSLVFAVAALFLVNHVNTFEREQALSEAEARAKLILDRNLAIHTYFSHDLKPKVFELTDPVRSENYFEPAWMSSTYAVRKINDYFNSMKEEEYYYKECAINARSPQNEADAFESSFIEELNATPQLQYRSMVRELDGKFYFVILRRGEVMEKTCLRCHSTPEKAPKGLIEVYGAERSFHRVADEIVSAISIRVPLSAAYARADQLSMHLSAVFMIVLLVIFLFQYLVYRFIIGAPIKRLYDKAVAISRSESHLGEEIPLPRSRELHELAAAFNAMSRSLRHQMDHLEESVAARTSELTVANSQLQQALAEVKTLRGILPLCSFCKKIRNDAGFWEQVDVYIHHHSEADISHSICPECLKKHYPEEYKAMKARGA